MAKSFTDKKFQLGEPLATQLQDFCAANYGAPAVRVIREAVKELIERRTAEHDMKERYEKARRDRLKLPEKVVRLAEKGKL